VVCSSRNALCVCVCVQVFELVAIALFENRRRPSPAWEATAVDLLAMAACLADSNLSNAGGAPSEQGWMDVEQTKQRLREACDLFRSFYQSGYKPAATFEAIDQVCCGFGACHLILRKFACIVLTRPNIWLRQVATW
jgi:hypothetical protein